MSSVGEEASWLDQDAPSGDEEYDNDDEERMVLNPVSVRQRIDVRCYIPEVISSLLYIAVCA